MGYSVIDIINKAIDCSKKRKDIYMKIGNESNNIPQIKIMSVVLIKGIDKTINYYEKLKKDWGKDGFEEIGFDTYDKISFLINDHNSRIFITEINNVKQFLELSITLEKDVFSLLMSIQGRLVKNTNDVESKTYKTLSKMIKFKSEHIKTLEKTIK